MNRGSDRNGSICGSTLTKVRKKSRFSYARSSHGTRGLCHPAARGRRQPVVHAPIVYDYVCHAPHQQGGQSQRPKVGRQNHRRVSVLRKPHRQTFPRRIGVMFCARKASPASVVSPLPFAGRTISFVSGGAKGFKQHQICRADSTEFVRAAFSTCFCAGCRWSSGPPP